MSTHNFKTLWEQWLQEIQKIIPDTNPYFNLADGITDETAAAQDDRHLGLSLPDALKDFYRIHNVAYHPITSVFSFSVNNWNYDLIPYEGIVDEWENTQDLNGELDDEHHYEEIDLPKEIKVSGYANPRWIPFADGRNGDCLLIDCDPGPEGVFGQIIELQNESWQRNLVANSLQELLEKQIQKLQNEEYQGYEFILKNEKNNPNLVAAINLKKNFIGLEIPTELLLLLHFQNTKTNADEENFSNGFYIGRDYSDKSGIKTYSENPAFLNALIEFAMADGTGSSYAFWLKDDNINLQKAPVIAIGSEGGMQVVAQNIKELFQILTFDAEPSISWESVYYFKEEDDHEPSEKSEAYRQWALETFSIMPMDDANAIVEKAQEVHSEAFNSWFQQYYVESKETTEVPLDFEHMKQALMVLMFQHQSSIFRNKFVQEKLKNQGFWEKGFWSEKVSRQGVLYCFSFNIWDEKYHDVHITWQHPSYPAPIVFCQFNAENEGCNIFIQEHGSSQVVLIEEKNEAALQFAVYGYQQLLDELAAKEKIRIANQEALEQLKQKAYAKPCERIVFDGINFKVIDIHEAYALIGELEDFKGDKIYDLYYNYGSENEFFLLAEDDVATEKLELDFNCEEVEDIEIVGFIFLKNLKAEQYILAHDLENSPLMVVLGQVETKNLHVCGNSFYIGNGLQCDTVWGKYNHGELFVKGETLAWLLFADDMNLHFERFAGVGAVVDSSGYRIHLLSIAEKNGETVFEENYFPSTAKISDIVVDGYWEIDENENQSILDKAIAEIILKNESLVDFSKQPIFEHEHFAEKTQGCIAQLIEHPGFKENGTVALKTEHELYQFQTFTEQGIEYYQIRNTALSLRIQTRMVIEAKNQQQHGLYFEYLNADFSPKLQWAGNATQNNMEMSAAKHGVLETCEKLINYILKEMQ